jgi:hypothetical protein
MRFGFCAIAVLLTGLQAYGTTACNVPSPRDLAGGAQLIVVATATSKVSWRVDYVVYGTAPGSRELVAGDDAIISACFDVRPGATYLVCERRNASSSPAHVLTLRRIEDAGEDLSFLSRRHFVQRAEVLDALEQWTAGELPTPRFVRWIATADTADTERDESVTVHIIEDLEWLATDSQRLERLNGALAARVRSGPLQHLLASLRTFNPAENEQEFNSQARSAEETESWEDVYDQLNVLIGAVWESPEWRTAAEILSADEEKRATTR